MDPEQRDGGSAEGSERPGLRGPAITALIALTGIGLVVAIEPFRAAAGHAVSGDTAALRAELDGLGGLTILLILSMLHAVVFYPAEILDAAAGFVYGFWLGLALVMVGWLLNAYVAYEIGRHAARPLLYRLFGRSRFESYERVIERGGVLLLLGMRTIPIVPFSLFSYAAGAARVPLGRLLWTTAIGYLPITGLFVYLGTRLESLSPTDPVLIGGGVALAAIVVIAHRLRGRLGLDSEPAHSEEGPGSG